MGFNNLAKGKFAEQKARTFLTGQNYKIIHTNWRCNLGEIDIVAREGSFLCFIEVKYRSSNSFGLPAEAVNYFKKQKLIKLAHSYIARETEDVQDIRFDVVEVFPDKINLIRNAFNTRP